MGCSPSRRHNVDMQNAMKRHVYLSIAFIALLFIKDSVCIDDRVLKRSNAKKWNRVAEVSRARARSAARQYLEDSSSELVVPIEIDIVLVGFSGDGGYGYTLESSRLLNLLSTHLQWYCPYSWETEEELGVCMHVNFQVISNEDEPLVGTLLHRVEAHLKLNMKQSHAAYDETLATGQRKYYSVEASQMEPLFNDFLDHLYRSDPGEDDTVMKDNPGLGGVTGTGSVVTGGYAGGKGGFADVWHKHNAIFVLNPSKVRINPDGPPEAASHVPPDFVGLWKHGDYNDSKLTEEEAGFIYRYQYNNAGETSVWHSSRNYLVIDLSAGPSTYGPVVSKTGAVTPHALPSLRDTYKELMHQLQNTERQQTIQESAREAAQNGVITLLAGRLAAVLASGVKAAFIPDIASQHVEHARTILVPLVVLSDHPPSENIQMTQDNYWGMNITRIEAALAHLLPEGCEGIVITAHHELHRHKQLAAALHKATRSHSEAVVDIPEGKDYSGHDMGIHSEVHTFIDPEVLLEEFEQSADMLTHGLVTVAHAMGKEHEHHIAQLRHEGTRVIPVFVLALENHPEDVVLSNRQLMAADDDSIIVLQLRHGSRWGGPDEFFTGHIANGRRVVIDGSQSTRHVIAGLATSLSGVVPPYQHYEPALQRLENDWLWAAGATPFGPYSNFEGVSEIMQNAARRNELLAHVGASLRQLQHQLDALDAFVEHHFRGPWDAAGIKDANRHWLDTVASSRHGYNTTLSSDAVFQLESALGNISNLLEDLAMDMFTHDFKKADVTVSDYLLPAVAGLCTQLDQQLDAAEEVMQCCRLGTVSIVSQAFMLIMACGGAAAVFFTLVGVALCARSAKRKAGKYISLPTYGLPMYSGKSRTWAL